MIKSKDTYAREVSIKENLKGLTTTAGNNIVLMRSNYKP
jgi:hypothetical protein